MGKIYGGHLVARYLKQVEGVDTVFERQRHGLQWL